MADLPKLQGLVLAGGRSRRMGNDKARIEFQGRDQLARAYAWLSALCEKTFVSVRADQRDDETRNRFPMIEDAQGIQGPMAGLVAAHDKFPDCAWLVLACDLPLLSEEALRQLITERTELARQGRNYSAITWRSPHTGRPEPLCTIWEPSALRIMRNHALAGGKCPGFALSEENTYMLEPQGDMLDNVNTPDDLEKALRMLDKKPLSDS